MKDLLFLREGHLQVDLCKLGLTVGTKILVPEAAHNLEIALIPADHEQLRFASANALDEKEATELYKGIPDAGLGNVPLPSGDGQPCARRARRR